MNQRPQNPLAVLGLLGKGGSTIAPITGQMPPARPAAPTGVDEVERLRQEAEAGMEHYRRIGDKFSTLTPPAPAPVMDKGSTLAASLAGIIAMLAGAPAKDVAEGYNAFVSSKEKGAREKDAYNQRAYEAKRQGLAYQGEQALIGASRGTFEPGAM